MNASEKYNINSAGFYKMETGSLIQTGMENLLRSFPIKSLIIFIKVVILTLKIFAAGFFFAMLTASGWSEADNHLPFPIRDHCMTFINSTTLMVIGGSQGSGYIAQTFYFHHQLTASPNSVVLGPLLTEPRGEMR